MDLRNYIYSHCVNPQTVKIWDSYSQHFVMRQVPCGHCLHCRNTHINEWVTRLVAHKKYSKFCYYVSLDYKPFQITDKVAHKLAAETAACYHNINKRGTYGMHPLVLCKNHLQDFYKRLRKNTGIKLQYFACGEYGMHANGRGFGRPHFHNIIFSNDPITRQDFIDAWTIDGYVIGRVDFVDISCSELGDKNNLNVFKYVCKYLQKADFDFENLATIDFHRTYFKSMQYCLSKTDTLFPELIPITDRSVLDFNWKQYTKLYAPFVVCSRRPSIGSAYLEENLERFKEQDFRLFGLPDICTSFPRYYVRRAKESLIDFRCLGEISSLPTTSARLGNVLQVLAKLQDDQSSVDFWNETTTSAWCIYKSKGIRYLKPINATFKESIKVSSLSFYDSVNKFLYQFNGYMYNVWAKLNDGSYTQFDQISIHEVLNEVKPSWDRYYEDWIKPMHDKLIQNERLFYDTVNALYKPTITQSSLDRFYDEVYARYNVELEQMYKRKLLMQNSKQEL